MARIRSVKPEAFRSRSLARVSRGARWTFAGIWTYVDDSGRGIDDPRLVKADIYPLDDDMTPAAIDDELDQLAAKAKVICRYEVGGERYLHVINFREHQHPNRPSMSNFPACPHRHVNGGVQGSLMEDAVSAHGGLTEGSQKTASPTVVRKGREGRGGKEELRSSSSSEFAAQDPDYSDEPGLDEPGSRDEVDRICDHLADRVEQNFGKRPNVGKLWRAAARRMLDIDGRTEQQVHAAIDWCQDDEFWAPNIRSTSKLREKYIQLRAQAQRSQRASNGHKPSTTDQRTRDNLKLAEKFAEQDMLGGARPKQIPERGNES